MDNNLKYYLLYALGEAKENAEILAGTCGDMREDIAMFEDLINQVRGSINIKESVSYTEDILDSSVTIEDIYKHTINCRIRYLIDGIVNKNYYPCGERYGPYDVPLKIKDFSNIDNRIIDYLQNVGKKTKKEFIEILKKYGVKMR